MKRTCPQCGAEVKEEAKFCTKCGMKINYPNGERVLNKKWYQKTGAIIILLILFFPIGLFLMWKYSNWNKWGKIVISCICAVVCLGTFPFGNSGIVNDNKNIIVENERVKMGALYNYSLGEAQDKISAILSDYYNQDIDLKHDFQVNPYDNGEGSIAYTYFSDEFSFAIELGVMDEKLSSILLKTYSEDQSGLEDIRGLFSIIVNNMTMDSIDTVEIEEIENETDDKNGNVVYYYRNNNLYIFGAESNQGMLTYYSVSASLEENANELGAQDIN